ncbi:MAG: hypothetical protein AAF360_00045 [Pseudomonadota bacterium]
MVAVASAAGGLTADEVVPLAEGLDLISADAARAAAGNAAATTSFVQATTESAFSPNAFAVSLADHNQFYLNNVFAGGYNLGQVFAWDASIGDSLVSVKGHTGVYSVDGNDRPVEFASAAFAARAFFWFSFRGAPHRHFVSALALATTVEVYGPNPTVNADGTSPDTPVATFSLGPLQTQTFQTFANGEYYLRATQPVVLTTTNADLAQDQRTVAPLSTSGVLIGHTPGTGSGEGYISALYPNTTITAYAQNGELRTATASPGAPAALKADFGFGDDTDYLPSGFIIFRADGPIAGFVGADSAGTNATTFYPAELGSYVVGIPMRLRGNQNSDVNIALASTFEGTARIYGPDGVLRKQLDLVRGGTLNSGVNTTIADQLHPAAARWAADEADFTADILRGSYIKADVPLYPVANLYDDGGGTDGDTATVGSHNYANDDETTLAGITPDGLRVQLREDDTGLLWRQRIDNAGLVQWVRA